VELIEYWVSFHSSKPTAVASPTLSHISVASWSALDNVYQQNVADATATILEVLQSPHNTWNYPSPLDITARALQPIVPQSPELVWPVLEDVENYPFLNVPDSPQYIVTSAPPSPILNTSLEVLADTTYHEEHFWLLEQDNLLPPPTQDSFVEQIFGGDPRSHIALENIQAAPLLSPIIKALVATVLSPAPKPRAPLADLLPLSEVPVADLFPNLFHAPACTFTVDHHPHQYQVVYDRGDKFWVPSEEFVDHDFLRLLPRIPNLETHPTSFITPFRANVYHNI